MNRLAKEPLLHFLLIGAAIFGLSARLSRSRPKENAAAPLPAIEISAGQIEQMRAAWQREKKRPPLEAELRQQIADYVREEMLYREALTLGLDRDDSVIRHRMAQKMQFLYDDIEGQTEPTEAAMTEYFTANTSRYLEPDGSTPPFIKVRERVSRDYQKATKEAQSKRTLEDLQKRYRISVDEAALQKAVHLPVAPPPS